MYAIGNHIHNIKKGVRTPTYAMRTYFSRAKLPIRLDIIFTPEKKKKFIQNSILEITIFILFIHLLFVIRRPVSLNDASNKESTIINTTK